VGRQVFTGVSATELPGTLERMLRVYLEKRQGRESFQQFTTRHDLNALQTLFSNNE
jgi:sulfite reductase beta subunit-like hemoprotein